MRYIPDRVPQMFDDEFIAYLERELDKISASMQQIEGILLQTMHVEPRKPRAGLIVLADGTDWNPGGGAGFYGYRDGAWYKLG